MIFSRVNLGVFIFKLEHGVCLFSVCVLDAAPCARYAVINSTDTPVRSLAFAF